MPNTKTSTAKKSGNTKQRTVEQESALKELFVDGLKDLLWAEKQLVKSLKTFVKAATSDELKSAFDTHRVETEGQIERLNQVFEAVGEKATAKKCDAMEGLAKEAEGLIEETEDGTEVRDVALISAAQKVEHYEIASYGTLKTLAGVLGFTEAQTLLEQTLEEEKKTDVLLTEIAEGFVNEAAKDETK
ncbi:YciE/YciF ferroxidase family protein [Desertivirga xinjiangensis]|uniref:YciE/YciF ferroxidase family protein n=1 Tax=Desertivirga xinjiangensis TaxID=539206 RepID=UPI00210A2578|nr:ferritin-like domain-containing protein [Pedobacter xinjiangensis]